MIDPDYVNPIWPGYPFNCDFELDDAYAPAGSVLRILLTADGQTHEHAIDVILTRPAAGQHRLSLTGLQTAPLRCPGMVRGDFVVRAANGSETVLNLRLSIPVEKPLTPATAP